MALTRGDIVLAVQADLGTSRPTVVVQADRFLETALTVLVCPLTTEISERSLTRPTVPAGTGTGLREASQIMADRMLALRRDRICNVIGALDSPTLEQLNQALLIVLGLIG